jgi:DNA polymerase III subunit epsilon
MQQYNYWESGTNEPPPSLKTKRQLAEIGLSAIKPVGFIETSKYTLHLYDPDSPESTRPKREPTPKQLENLQKGRAKAKYKTWYKNGGFIEEARVKTVGWARKLILEGCLILDTETTGLGKAEIVEIAIINHQGEVLLNSLVRPTIEIPSGATSIHGITSEMVEAAPTFPEIYPRIKEIIEGKKIAIYNSDADIGFLNYCCKLHKLKKLKLEDTICLMYWYSRWYGKYSGYWRDYKFQPLNGGHRALQDCLAALSALKEIVEDDPEMKVPDL